MAFSGLYYGVRSSGDSYLMSNSSYSSFPGSMDEGVSEGLPSMQSTSNTGGHAEDDERYDLLQLAARQVMSSKEYIDIKLTTWYLSHTCKDNKCRCCVEMSNTRCAVISRVVEASRQTTCRLT